MHTDTLRLILGLVTASIATYATAWSIRRRREDRRWWWLLLVSVGSWAFSLWYLLR